MHIRITSLHVNNQQWCKLCNKYISTQSLAMSINIAISNKRYWIILLEENFLYFMSEKDNSGAMNETYQ